METKSPREIEEELAGRKSWKYTGEVRASSRPHNSLLKEDVEFDTSLFNVPISKAENNEIVKYITQRFREKTFDNYEFTEKEEVAEAEAYDTTPIENSREIVQMYEEIEKELLRMTDYGRGAVDCLGSPATHMNAQLWHDAALAVRKAGKDDENLVFVYFLWSGKKKTAEEIRSAYSEISEMAKEQGYSVPLDFLQDRFSGAYRTEIAQYDEPLEAEMVEMIIKECKKVDEDEKSAEDEIEQFIQLEESVMPSAAVVEKAVSEPKSTQVQKSEECSYTPSPVTRPEKLPSEPFEGTPIQIPPHIRCKLTKYKRITNCYRQMDQKKKDVDNKFDYFLSKAMSSTSGRFFYDNTEFLGDYPLIGSKASEEDMKFRKIMSRVSTPGNHPGTDRSMWQDEIIFFKEYFESKCGKIPSKDFVTKRLATTVAYLMRQIQTMYFNTPEGPAADKILFFKAQLVSFYNFYKK